MTRCLTDLAKPDWLEQVWMEVQAEIEYETKHPQEEPSWVAEERIEQEKRLKRLHPL